MPPIDASSLLVKKFYADSMGKDQHIIFRVHGVDILVTPNIVRQVMGFAEMENPTLNTNTKEDLTQVATFLTGAPRRWNRAERCKQEELKVEFKVLHNIIYCNILSTIHTSTLTTERAAFIATLAKGTNF